MKLVLLGASGSIGQSTIEVLKNEKTIDLIGFSVRNRTEVVEDLIRQFPIQFIVLKNESDYIYFKEKYKNIIFFYGDNGILQLIEASKADIVFNALSGFAGVLPSFKAIELDKKLCLANKETLVIAGELFNALLKDHPKAELYPVDSEHSAVYKCLKQGGNECERIIITASGGPFFDYDKESFKNINVEDALNHPTWSMGKKITIDSSTMINKVYEIIEASYLFNLDYNHIDVLVDRTSNVHGIVEYKDKYLINKGIPDMKIPIKYVLDCCFGNFDTNDVYKDDLNKYNLKTIDNNKFELFNLAEFILNKKGDLGCVLNACDEVTVDSFLKNEITYLELIKIIKKIVLNHDVEYDLSIEKLISIDKNIRELTRKEIEGVIKGRGE